MPYKCILENGKWRLVDPETKNIVKNDNGNAVDGGGHDTKQGCKNQAQAILANEYK